MSVVPDTSPQLATRYLHEYRDLLHFISLYYHNHAGRMLIEKHLGKTKRRAALTRREKECLQWAAAGKSTWETSMILGLSEAGIIFHIENAKKKLDVCKRTQAVVTAIMMGLIEPS